MLPPIVKGESLYYWSVHRDEKRLALDLKNEKGLEVVHKLVKESDVLLENFRPGVMGRLGLGYGKLHALNPRLVYLSISSYGQNSSWHQRPGHDLNLQAETGTLWLNRQTDGKPVVPGNLLTDFTTALFSALSVVSGVLQRNFTDKGKHLDVSMFDSTMYMQSLAATAQAYFKSCPPQSDPQNRAEIANYNIYKCADGRYLAAAPLEPQFWQSFCEKIGKPEWKTVLSFGANPELRAQLDDIFATKTLSQWLEVFAAGDCCVSPVNTLEEALDFLPVQERDLFHTLVHPLLGEVPQLRAPLPFDRKHAQSTTIKPNLAESSMSILLELGYSAQEIEALAAAKVIPATTLTCR